jgi:transcriptional regulator with XRE-family HTH domain
MTTQAKVARDSDHFRIEGLSLGSRVRALRNEQGWTLEEAGLRMNMDPKHLWKLERAYEGLNVTLVTLVRIAEAFHIPVQSLFAYRGEIRTPTPRRRKGTLKKKSALPFDYIDSPKVEHEYDTYLPFFSLSDLTQIHTTHPFTYLTPKTWVLLHDQSIHQANRFVCPFSALSSDEHPKKIATHNFALFDIQSWTDLESIKLESMSSNEKAIFLFLKRHPDGTQTPLIQKVKVQNSDTGWSLVLTSPFVENDPPLILKGIDLLHTQCIGKLVQVLN